MAYRFVIQQMEPPGVERERTAGYAYEAGYIWFVRDEDTVTEVIRAPYTFATLEEAVEQVRLIKTAALDDSNPTQSYQGLG